MRLRWLAAPLLLLAPVTALAQTATLDPDTITVRGVPVGRNGKPVDMSSWYVAETEHVLVYGTQEERITRLAHNLEKLHLLLSTLFSRLDDSDDAVKLSVVLVNNDVDFRRLDLRGVRAQRGPFPAAFPGAYYYDPRDDGAVLATTAEDQKIALDPGTDLFSALTRLGPQGVAMQRSLARIGQPDLEDARTGEVAYLVTPESRIYAGYAQHYLLTYFPAAYPRWYLDGFGEVFATIDASQDGAIQYGEVPEGYLKVLDWYGRYPVSRLLDGSYLAEPGGRPRWTPIHAFALVHLLFFSESWREPLRAYLEAVANGASRADAAVKLDAAKLQAELAGYRGRKIPNDRLYFPAERAPPPLLRQLTRAESWQVRERLLLGSRLDPPSTPREARKVAGRRRDWLRELRRVAGRYPESRGLQLVLAEAECRSGNAAGCLDAADLALVAAPGNATALAWRGVALTQQALAGPAARRAEGLRGAREALARAIRADSDGVRGLLAYSASFADAGEPLSADAVAGLEKAVARAPWSAAARLRLGEALAKRGDATGARVALLPVAQGAWDSPERARAAALLAALAR
ncbi:hypothetical protein [Sphingomonas sp.]|uniref:tetratricopeptide repeat protein n=1 Tax=Sphingomonas sp. TaxID=28214 RepID=UPI001B139DBC|nr:hypothetical protein [Sphingomonas sp.]MBO9714955.1 hypothetical protein [Sphingomonas sp.]